MGTGRNRLLVCALLLAQVGWLVAGPGAVAQAASCESRWYISYGGDTSYVKVRTDRSGLRLSELSFDWGYSDPFANSQGYIDFNGDGKTDIFSTKRRADGSYLWRYSSAGTSSWTNLRSSSISPGQLRFGDFEGDGVTDVFAVLAPNEIGIRQWVYSDDGLSEFKPLAAIDTRGASAFRFGDFDGDARTDVFSTHVRDDGYLQWQYSSGGNSPYAKLAYANTPLDKMRFGDVDGDGYSDVFTTLPTSDTSSPWLWVYSPRGEGNYTTLRQTTIEVGNIKLGLFNDDFITDMFLVLLESDGFYHWYYAYHTATSIGGEALAYDNRPISQLRLGDFNGDQITDVFTLKRVCV